ncbi:MAG: acyl--CoA ligase [Oscillospiraceae bacterium]|nr:acyl--CoA ligase [Oscillospiraceae bacterium]
MSLSVQAPWLQYYGDMPAHLDYPSKTIYQIVRDTARAHPELVAYEFMGKQTSYARFMDRVERTARALHALGIGRGDRVTICMPNTPQAVDTFYALSRIGAVSNMIHPLSAPAEIAFYLNFSRSKAILTLDQFYPKLEEIRDRLDHPVKFLIAFIRDELPAPLRLLYPASKAARKIPKLPKDGDYVRWKDFLHAGESVQTLPPDEMSHLEGASILYSGGTTGTTKGILLSSANFNATALQTIAASGLPNIVGKKMLSVMPVFHGFGLGIGIHTALVGGACCILVPQFNVKTYAQLLLKKQPNLIPGVPTLFEALLRTNLLENADLSFLDGMFSGGDSLSVELKRKVDDFLKAHHAKIQIREGYGTTECVTASCLTPKDYARSGSIGIPFPDTWYKIVKPGTEEALGPDEEGEICISGPSVMMCYIDNPAETAQTLRHHADGRTWCHTGDLGTMDADGFVYFRQRIKRMIITSGYNVYPSQVENVIDGHEKVLYSCVVGVKDSYKMQKVKAFVVLRPEYQPSEEIRQELMEHCRKNIVKYAVPYAIEFRDELPKTLVGKVAYRVLEEEANAEGQT